jgi:hypothetical protein
MQKQKSKMLEATQKYSLHTGRDKNIIVLMIFCIHIALEFQIKLNFEGNYVS